MENTDEHYDATCACGELLRRSTALGLHEALHQHLEERHGAPKDLAGGPQMDQFGRITCCGRSFGRS